MEQNPVLSLLITYSHGVAKRAIKANKKIKDPLEALDHFQGILRVRPGDAQSQDGRWGLMYHFETKVLPPAIAATQPEQLPLLIQNALTAAGDDHAMLASWGICHGISLAPQDPAKAFILFDEMLAGERKTPEFAAKYTERMALDLPQPILHSWMEQTDIKNLIVVTDVLHHVFDKVIENDTFDNQWNYESRTQLLLNHIMGPDWLPRANTSDPEAIEALSMGGERDDQLCILSPLLGQKGLAYIATLNPFSDKDLFYTAQGGWRRLQYVRNVLTRESDPTALSEFNGFAQVATHWARSAWPHGPSLTNSLRASMPEKHPLRRVWRAETAPAPNA